MVDARRGGELAEEVLLRRRLGHHRVRRAVGKTAGVKWPAASKASTPKIRLSLETPGIVIRWTSFATSSACSQKGAVVSRQTIR